MFDAAARELLSQPIIVRISTIDRNGYPHVVPVWFILDGDDLVVFTARRTAKVKHIRNNPKGSIAVGGDPAGNPGYLIIGDYEVEDDTDWTWAKRITYHYEEKSKAEEDFKEWEGGDFVAIRLKPSKVLKV